MVNREKQQKLMTLKMMNAVTKRHPEVESDDEELIINTCCYKEITK